MGKAGDRCCARGGLFRITALPTERQDPAVRVTIDIHAGPSRRNGINYGGHILVLPLQAVLRSIPAGTPAAPVDGVNSDMRFQERQQGMPPRVVGLSAVDENQRRSVPAWPKRDLRAVARGHPRDQRSLMGSHLDPLLPRIVQDSHHRGVRGQRMPLDAQAM
jgi:hypothetical protein